MCIALSIEIQMQINVRGLCAVMSQMVHDVCDGMAAVVHVDCPAVTKGMDRIDIDESFGRKRFFEVFFADSVDAMTSECLPPLVDKKPVLIRRFWRDAVSSDVELKEMAGFGFDFYKSKPVCLSQNCHRLVLGVEVVQIQRGYLGGPGA